MPRAKRQFRHHLDRRLNALLNSPDAAGPDNEMLDANQVAEWFQVTMQWLTLGRASGYGPKVTQLTATKFGYRRGDVRAWLRERAKTLEAA